MELENHVLQVGGEPRTFAMLPSGALWEEEEQTLYLSDLHLGKGEHFRSQGISVPWQVDAEGLGKLAFDLNLLKPGKVYFLGDLFHSVYNSAVDKLGRLLEDYAQISFHLVPGNHDILQEDKYRGLSLQMEPSCVWRKGLVLVHDAQDIVDQGEDHYFVAGHIHPGVLMRGKGRQKLQFPCFYWSHRGVFLPAYGLFTGVKVLKPLKGEKVYIVAKNKVMAVKP
jgi:uncharacterized protein